MSTTDRHSSDDDGRDPGEDQISRALELYRPTNPARREEAWQRVRGALRRQRSRARRRLAVTLASSALILAAGLGGGYALGRGGLAAHAAGPTQDGRPGPEAEKVAGLEREIATLRADLMAAKDQVKSIPGLQAERDALRTERDGLLQRPEAAFGTYKFLLNPGEPDPKKREYRKCKLLALNADRVRIENELSGLRPEEETVEIGHWDPKRRGFVFPQGSIAFWVEPTETQTGRLVIWFPGGNGARHWEKAD